MLRRFATSAMSAAIRGIRVSEFGGPDVLKYATDLPVPSKPTGKQVLVQVKYAGVNPVDTYIRGGGHNIKPALPYTPGSDGAGIVLDVGDGITRLKKGDTVYWARCIDGSYKEVALTSEEQTFPLHKNLSFQQGAALGVPYYTAYRALINKAHLKPGETVLVHGASGATGIACCQIARALGAHVLGTAGTPEGLQLVLANGAHEAFNHRTDGYTNEIKRSTEGVNVIIEMLANANLEKDLQLASYAGRIVIIGSRDKAEITPRFTMTNELTIMGVMLFKNTERDWEEMSAFMHAGQEQGWLQPVIGTEYPIDQASEAHKEVIAHSAGAKGKIVLKM